MMIRPAEEGRGTSVTIAGKIYRTLEATVYGLANQVLKTEEDEDAVPVLIDKDMKLYSQGIDTSDFATKDELEDVADDLEDLSGTVSGIEGRVTQNEYDIGQAQTDIAGLGNSKQDKAVTDTVTILAADWTASGDVYVYTKTGMTGVKADSIVFSVPASGSEEDFASNGIKCVGQAAGSLTYQCDTVPDNSVTANVVIF